MPEETGEQICLGITAHEKGYKVLIPGRPAAVRCETLDDVALLLGEVEQGTDPEEYLEAAA